MNRIRGYLAVAIASSALTALGGAGGLGAATTDQPSNTARPTISGTVADGQTLTGAVGSWTGTPPIAYVYHWIRCDTKVANCHTIGGADNSTYRVATRDVGRRLVLRVDATNGEGSDHAYSNATGVVATNPDLPANTSKPIVTGDASVGSVLTGHEGAWSGKTPIVFSYHWQRCDGNGNRCGNIRGATHGSYRVSSGDAGHRLRFQVHARNDTGSSDATSDPTNVVAGRPVVVTKPSIGGTAQQGATLTVNPGAWSGSQPVTLSIQWQRCDRNGNNCVSLSGATHTTFVLTSADVGHRMRVHVHAQNAAGAAGSTTSATAVVAAGAPPPPALPPGAVKLADGSISIPVTSVSLPDQLIIDKLEFNPTIVTSLAPFQARFHVVNTKGYVIRDALVYMIGIPYGRVLNVPEQPTAQDGWATVTVQPTAKFPLVQGGALVIFVRARKPGDNLLAGVSARRLVQVTTSSPQ